MQEKLFQFSNDLELQAVVRGDKLSASPKPLIGRLCFRLFMCRENSLSDVRGESVHRGIGNGRNRTAAGLKP